MLLYSQNWWIWFLRGLAGIFFGIFAFAAPGMTIDILILGFGIYALIDGLVHLLASFHRTNYFRIWHILEGLFGILAGVLTLAWPLPTSAVLLSFIAIWAILTGIIRLAHSSGLRQHYTQEWLLVLSGILSIVFGVVALAAPIVGALAIALWVGIYTFILGILYIRLAFWLRSHHPTMFAATGAL